MSVFWADSWLHPEPPVVVAVAALALAAPMLRLRVRGRRPRFVVVLCVAGIVAACYELTELFTLPWSAHRQALLGLDLRGTAAGLAAMLDVLLCLVGAWGLWKLRSWGRMLAMGYLGYVLASFLIWGARGLTSGGDELLWIVVAQILVLPFVTFSLMYLHGGARHFGVEARRADKKTDWLY